MLVLVGSCPFLCCFAILLGGETQIRLGDLRVVFCLAVVLVVWFVSHDDLPEIFGPHVSCTLLLFTAYAIVRTVPSANRPNRRKKWCQCDNCEFQDWQLGRAMDRHQQMLQKMTHLFESLPPFLAILPAQFCDDPELVFTKQMHVQLFLINLGIWKMKLILAAVMKTVTNATVCGILTLAGLVVVQELRTQDSSLDSFNKNPVARHLEGSTDDAAEFSQGWFPMSTAELF